MKTVSVFSCFEDHDENECVSPSGPRALQHQAHDVLFASSGTVSNHIAATIAVVALQSLRVAGSRRISAMIVHLAVRLVAIFLLQYTQQVAQGAVIDFGNDGILGGVKIAL